MFIENYIGKIIGKCRLEEFIGSGGMGAVYKARHLLLNKVVAVKLLHPNLVCGESGKEITERFIREGRAAARLDHPNIVAVYDIGLENSVYYMVMQFIAAETLLENIGRQGPLDIVKALNMTKEVAKGLQEAHGKGIIHRDIKPANILCSKESDDIKITDFGLAKEIYDDSHLSQIGRVFGTPLYLSPEQALGERNIDGRADLYSLGVTFYQSLTGNPPYVGSTSFIIMQQHVYAPIPSLVQKFAEVPEEVEYLLYKLMAKNRDDRFSCAQEVVKYIESFENGLEIGEKEADFDFHLSLGKIPPTKKIKKQKRPAFVTRKFRVTRSEDGVKISELDEYSSGAKKESPSSQKEQKDADFLELGNAEKVRIVIGEGGVECIPSLSDSVPSATAEGPDASIPFDLIKEISDQADISEIGIVSQDKKIVTSIQPLDAISEEAGKEKIRIQLGPTGVEFVRDDEKIMENLAHDESGEEKIRIQLGPAGVECVVAQETVENPKTAPDAEKRKARKMKKEEEAPGDSSQAKVKKSASPEKRVFIRKRFFRDLLFLIVFIVLSLLLFGWLLIYVQ